MPFKLFMSILIIIYIHISYILIRVRVMLPFTGDYQVGYLDYETQDILVRIYYPTKDIQPERSLWTDFPRQYGWGILSYMKAKYLQPFMATILYFQKGYLKPGATICTDKKWPVMFYSHGLSGQRLIYSQYIGELVSLGMIVIALEHRDKSGSASAINACQKWMYYEIPNLPPGQKEDEFYFDFRMRQIEFRKEEILKAKTLAEMLNKGEAVINLMQRLQRPIDKDEFKGCMDLKQLFIGGHSFGAATAIHFLQQSSHPFLGGLILEPWMMPVNIRPIQTPVIFIQSEVFYTVPHIDKFKNLVKQCANATVSVICKTKHQDIADGMFMFYYALRWMKECGTQPVRMTYDIARNLSCSFLANLSTQFHKIPGFYPNPNDEPHPEIRLGQDAIQHLYDHAK